MSEADINNNILKLENALSSGIKEVDINGQKTQYNSVGELIAAINYYKRKLANINAGGRLRFHPLVGSKGIV